MLEPIDEKEDQESEIREQVPSFKFSNESGNGVRTSIIASENPSISVSNLDKFEQSGGVDASERADYQNVMKEMNKGQHTVS